MATEPRKDIIDAFGREGPRYAEVAMCCARKEDDARTTAHRFFRWSLTGWPVQAELPDPKGFAAASTHIAPAAVAEKISCGPSAARHLEAIRKFTQAGFDHIVLVQIGPDQDYFFDLFKRELAPALRR